MFKGPEVSEHQGNVESANVAGERQRATVRAAASDRRDPWSTKVRLGAIRAVAPYHLARAGGGHIDGRHGAEPASALRDGLAAIGARAAAEGMTC